MHNVKSPTWAPLTWAAFGRNLSSFIVIAPAGVVCTHMLTQQGITPGDGTQCSVTSVPVQAARHPPCYTPLLYQRIRYLACRRPPKNGLSPINATNSARSLPLIVNPTWRSTA
eukprot:7346251-Pyramimonas_sp.AAC.1